MGLSTICKKIIRFFLGDASELFFLGVPEVCIFEPTKPLVSKLYIPREKCACGGSTWIEKGCTMMVCVSPCGHQVYPNVHRCGDCYEVRMADYVKKDYPW